MKILIINSSDKQGGAARAAYRLHKGLQKFGIKSEMLVQKKFSDDNSVFMCENDKSLDLTYFERMQYQIYQNKTKTLFTSAIVSNNEIINFINNSDFDIVHLHWIANVFISIEDIGKINKPIIWSLHDMWAFTGGCHYDEECGAYENECGNCKILQSSIQNDLSNKIWNIKKIIFSSCENLTIIGLSNWLFKSIKKSSLLAKKQIVQLPNPLNINFFISQEKKEARNYFNLPQDKKLILFGAMNSTSDPRKGYEKLKIALTKFNTENVEFVVFGNLNEEEQCSKYKINFLGNIDDDNILVKLYSAVDIVISPSLQENLANIISEALSCSTPVVAFDIGGNSDMIVHKINGYLAKPFDEDDLANGIEWILSNPNYEQLCANSREKIVQTFSEDVVIPKYVDLYNDTISNHKKEKTRKEIFYIDSSIIDLLIKSFHYYINEEKNLNFSKNFNTLFQQVNNIEGNIILYGNGIIGKTIQYLIPGKILGYVDISEREHHPSNLKNINFDKIIISVLGREKEIIKYLTEDIGIEIEKIITLEL